MKFKFKELAESLSVAAVLLFVLLPVRILFVKYISDDWIGSFGLITAISVMIIYLAKKDKLGWFGRAFHRQMWKIHTGKRRYFVYTQLGVSLLFFAYVNIGIVVGESAYSDQKQELQDQLQINSIQELNQRTAEEVKPQDVPAGLFVFVYILFFRFDIFATIVSTLNDITDGWMLHFSQVFMVEVIELIGITIYTKFTIKTEKTGQAF